MKKTYLLILSTLLLTSCDFEINPRLPSPQISSSSSQSSSQDSSSDSSSQQEHTHSFDSSWSHNETKHWHEATCGHDVKQDEQEHSYENGVCSVCGYEDPSYVKNEFYLPSHITSYNGSYDKIIEDITYSYDSNLLGYTKTRILDLDEKSKDVDIVSFSEDYNSYTIESLSYNYLNDNYVLSDKEKNVYEFNDDNSYTRIQYLYDIDKNDYVYNRLDYYKYNNRNQLVLTYTKKDNPDKEGSQYYYSYITYSYDESGYPLRSTYYDYDNTVDRNMYIYYYDEYNYDNNMRDHCVIQSYYYNDTAFVKDGWTDVLITNEDGIIKFDEQIYQENGTKGNHNITWYDNNFRKVYTYYGGMGQENGITVNNNNQITNYFFEDNSSSLNLDVTYNNMLLATSKLVQESSYLSSTSNTSFTYNDNNQLVKVVENTVYDFDDGIDSEHLEFADEVNITYLETQNDKLYSKLDYIHDIVSSFAYYILNSDEEIY